MPKKRAQAVFLKGTVIAPMSDQIKELYDKSRFGELVEDTIHLSVFEALYLIEKKKLDVSDYRNNVISSNEFLKKSQRIDKAFVTKYAVFKDLRNRGYIVKTALKFGADFRVYDRGIKPGEDHARWIVFPVHENAHFTWYDFSAKNRVAHSTRKRLLIAVVDVEADVTYYEVGWKRP